MIDPIYGQLASQYSLAERDEHQQLLAKIQKATDVTLVAKPRPSELWELTVVTQDRLSILSLISGLLSALRIRIVRGDVFTVPPVRDPTNQPGKALNILEVTGSGMGKPEDWENVRAELNQLVQRVARGQMHEAQEQIIDRVSRVIGDMGGDYETLMHIDTAFDNDSDPHLTGLHVHSVETPGFLFSFTNALSMLETDIHRATIRTESQGIHDIFWIRDQSGQKIESPSKLQQIRTASVLIKQFAYLLPQSADPHQALRQFRELVKRLLRGPSESADIDRLRSRSAMRTLAKVMGVSQHLWEDFLRMQHENLFPLVSDATRLDRGRRQEELKTALASELAEAIDEDDQVRRLNRFKDREIFRADLRHITGRVAVAQFTREITNVADVAVSQAMQLCYDRMVHRFGHPRLETNTLCRWSVLGLGKCGGREMGFASDIELMIIYEGGGQTDGERSVDNQEFFIEMVCLFLKVFQTHKEGIFEVDLRLRPYGKDGVLASSLEAFEKYYDPAGHARQFERMALVRLRALGGHPDLGMEVEKRRDGFVYSNVPLDIADIQHLRERQTRELSKPGTTNAKYSAGGLVAIEYFVQAMQIAMGDDQPRLRVTNTVEAVEALETAGVITSALATQICEIYGIMRRLIDALRVVRGHAKDLSIPASETRDFMYLARRLGYEQSQDLETAIEKAMQMGAGLWLNQNYLIQMQRGCIKTALNLVICTDTHARMKLPEFKHPPALAWLHGGDFYQRSDGRRGRPLGAEALKRYAGQRETMERWLLRCPLPIFTVRGNHDVTDPWGFFARTHVIDGQIQELLPNLSLAGIGWSGAQFYHLPNNQELAVVCDHLRGHLLEQCQSGHRLLILSHYPANTELCEGYDCIDRLLAEFRPLVLIQGHIHEAFGQQIHIPWPDGSSTLVINPGAQGGVLSLQPDSLAATFLPASSP